MSKKLLFLNIDKFFQFHKISHILISNSTNFHEKRIIFNENSLKNEEKFKIPSFRKILNFLRYFEHNF